MIKNKIRIKTLPVCPRHIETVGNHGGVRTCVIFNPVARGNKARHFRRWLDGVAAECALKPTAGPNDARRLAAAAVRENFDLVVAAGGDGTVNEVLNGLGDAPDGFDRARLGVLPLGTVNVFARELGLPPRLEAAWEILRRGREQKIDLPTVEFSAKGKIERRYFAQLAGAGLDARAIELVSWRLKKKTGPFAYVVAGFQALWERQPKITVRADGQILAGELVLIGNGKLYGGAVAVFPAADLQNGRLEVCLFPRVNFWRLLRCAPGLLVTQKLPEKLVRRIGAARLELTSEAPVAFELDGEWVGNLPATFFIAPQKLRVVVP
jgi:YegS/Rv2252/BmrU family lipid kinase